MSVGCDNGRFIFPKEFLLPKVGWGSKTERVYTKCKKKSEKSTDFSLILQDDTIGLTLSPDRCAAGCDPRGCSRDHSLR